MHRREVVSLQVNEANDVKMMMTLISVTRTSKEQVLLACFDCIKYSVYAEYWPHVYPSMQDYFVHCLVFFIIIHGLQLQLTYFKLILMSHLCRAGFLFCLQQR